MAATVECEETILRYTDDEGNMLETRSPWFSEIEYGTEIVVPNVK